MTCTLTRKSIHPQSQTRPNPHEHTHSDSPSPTHGSYPQIHMYRFKHQKWCLLYSCIAFRSLVCFQFNVTYSPSFRTSWVALPAMALGQLLFSAVPTIPLSVKWWGYGFTISFFNILIWLGVWAPGGGGGWWFGGSSLSSGKAVCH